ncbi:MAG: hypothetical protein JOY51_09495 [Nevskia sp.]|nr:hypothetical protein [Nevskia sp.]
MSSTAILMKSSGLVLAIAAHAAFVAVLLAGQPAPGQYLARLAPHILQAPEVQMAARPDGALRKTAAPVRLLRGSSTC